MLPVWGLNDTADIYKKTRTESYGDIVITEELYISGWRCRKTITNNYKFGMLDMQVQGKAYSDYWNFIGEYDNRILKGMMLYLGTKKYEIIQVDERRDNLGNYHHLSVVAEGINT